MRAASSLAAVIALVAACDRPPTLLICHNGNCSEPTDPARDDTIEALNESLALEFNGAPLIDGIELDSFWRGEDSTCLYAHDLDAEQQTPATAPAVELAAHFAKPGPLTFAPGPFHISLELKPHVAVSKTSRHTAEQRYLHALCTWDIYRIISDGAVANGRDVEIVFSSFEPKLLSEIIATAPASTPTPYRFGAIFGIPAPLDAQTQPLGAYAGVPIDFVELHAQWVHDAQVEGVRSTGAEIILWMFSATVETFDAIELLEPAMVGTSEARLMRRWLER